MNRDRIRELLAPFVAGLGLSDDQLATVETYLALLLKWNARINLTAVRNPDEIVTRHFGESLFAARHLFPDRISSNVIDVGSGAGFPGLPLKIWAPGLSVTLIESNHRKATFLNEAVRALELPNVTVVSRRAEELTNQAELVTFRAVEKFEQVLQTASRLVAPSGRIAILVGDSQIPIAKGALPEVRWEDPIAIPQSSSRRLLVGTVS